VALVWGFIWREEKGRERKIVNYCLLRKEEKGETKINNSSVSIWYIMWICYGKKEYILILLFSITIFL